MSVPTTLAGKAVLVTGAGRGLGRALVEEALHRGADRVYAAARRPVEHPDPRITPVRLDITDPEQTGAYRQAFERLAAVALTGERAIGLIRHIRGELQSMQ